MVANAISIGDSDRRKAVLVCIYHGCNVCSHTCLVCSAVLGSHGDGKANVAGTTDRKSLEAEEFINCIVCLFSDVHSRSPLAECGNKIVQTKHGWGMCNARILTAGDSNVPSLLQFAFL